MLNKAVLALDELEKWKERQCRIRDKATAGQEMENVNKQVAYYTDLIRDMKQEMCRPGLLTLLRSMSR